MQSSYIGRREASNSIDSIVEEIDEQMKYPIKFLSSLENIMPLLYQSNNIRDFKPDVTLS